MVCCTHQAEGDEEAIGSARTDAERMAMRFILKQWRALATTGRDGIHSSKEDKNGVDTSVHASVATRYNQP